MLQSEILGPLWTAVMQSFHNWTGTETSPITQRRGAGGAGQGRTQHSARRARPGCSEAGGLGG